MLEVKQVSKVYEGKVPYRALSNIDITIDKGEFVGVMGPSGSVKTTLLNVISTIDEPTTGEVLVDGKNPHKLKKNDMAKGRSIEIRDVLEDFNLINRHKIKKNRVMNITINNQL